MPALFYNWPQEALMARASGIPPPASLPPPMALGASQRNLMQEGAPQQAPAPSGPLFGGGDQASASARSSGSGFFGALERGLTSPLTLAGIGLMSGGFPAALQGLRAGQRSRLLPFERMVKEAQAKYWTAKTAGKLGGAGSKYGLNPIYGVDAEGNPIIMQLNQAGGAIETPLPEGVQLRKQPIRMDAGTHWVIMDPVTRQPVGMVPKDIEGQKAQESAGKGRGEAQVNLPTALEGGRRMLEAIDAALGDPALSRVTGPIQGRLPNITSGAARAQATVNKILGGTFVTAYQQLKGGGQITEYEGKNAAASYNRLTTQTMSDEDYRAELQNFRSEVLRLMDLARRRAGGGTGGAGAGGGGWSARRLD